MSPRVRTACAALLFVYPGWLGAVTVTDAWCDARSRARILDAGLALAPAAPERDYLFLREVGACLRAGDRLAIIKDPLSELIDIAIPLLAAGWHGPTEVLFDVPPASEIRAWLARRRGIQDEAAIAMWSASLAPLRRSPEEFARAIAAATVVVAWSSGWRPDQGSVLVAAGVDLNAWRLR